MNKNTLSVLIIEEEPIRKLLRMLVEQSGHSVDIAGNYMEALRKISHGVFDLILMDIHLSDGNGVELMGKAKSLCPEVAIVAMSGRVSLDEELKIREHRAICILIKPFSKKILQDILDHVTKRKDLTRGQYNRVL